MIEPQKTPTTMPTTPTVKITERAHPSRKTSNPTQYQHVPALSITHTNQPLPTTGRPVPSLYTCPPVQTIPNMTYNQHNLQNDINDQHVPPT